MIVESIRGDFSLTDLTHTDGEDLNQNIMKLKLAHHIFNSFQSISLDLTQIQIRWTLILVIS